MRTMMTMMTGWIVELGSARPERGRLPMRWPASWSRDWARRRVETVEGKADGWTRAISYLALGFSTRPAPPLPRAPISSSLVPSPCFSAFPFSVWPFASHISLQPVVSFISPFFVSASVCRLQTFTRSSSSCLYSICPPPPLGLNLSVPCSVSFCCLLSLTVHLASSPVHLPTSHGLHSPKLYL